MKEQIKVTNNWVYIKCSKCGIKKDFKRAWFDKKFKESGLSDDAAGLEIFASSFVCAGCLKDKQKPVVISKSEQRRIALQQKEKEDNKAVVPYTKEKQLGKKEKNSVSKEQKDKEMEDLLAK